MNKTDKLGKGLLLRGKTYWYRRMVNGEHLQISLHTSDPVEALRIATDIKNTGSVTYASAKKTTGETLDDQIARYIDSRAGMNKHTEATTSWAKRALGQFSAHVKNKSIKAVTAADIEGFYQSLRKRKYGKAGKKKQFSENAAHSYLRAVRGFTSWAHQQKLTFVNPAKTVKVGKASQPAKIRFATREEREAILAAATNDSTRFILYCAFWAGMRFNEIVEAKPDWFNLEENFIHIHNGETTYPDGRVVKFVTKNKKNRYVPLSPRFKEFLTHYRLKSPFMLEPDVQHGLGYRYDFRKPWRKVMQDAAEKLNADAKKAGKLPMTNFDWLTPHIARHTFASLLAQHGTSIYKIAQWIGDGVKVCTDHYAHLAPSDNAINAID